MNRTLTRIGLITLISGLQSAGRDPNVSGGPGLYNFRYRLFVFLIRFRFLEQAQG